LKTYTYEQYLKMIESTIKKARALGVDVNKESVSRVLQKLEKEGILSEQGLLFSCIGENRAAIGSMFEEAGFGASECDPDDEDHAIQGDYNWMSDDGIVITYSFPVGKNLSEFMIHFGNGESSLFRGLENRDLSAFKLRRLLNVCAEEKSSKESVLSFMSTEFRMIGV